MGAQTPMLPMPLMCQIDLNNIMVVSDKSFMGARDAIPALS